MFSQEIESSIISMLSADLIKCKPTNLIDVIFFHKIHGKCSSEVETIPSEPSITWGFLHMKI